MIVHAMQVYGFEMIPISTFLSDPGGVLFTSPVSRDKQDRINSDWPFTNSPSRFRCVDAEGG